MQFKISAERMFRKEYRPDLHLVVQTDVDCPLCKAKAGYWCITSSGKRAIKYHRKRFTAYLRNESKKGTK